MQYNFSEERIQDCIIDLELKYGLIHIVQKFKEGRNNAVLKIKIDKKYYILKIYNNEKINVSKFLREVSFLMFLKSIGFRNSPYLIYKNLKKLYILISPLEGSKIINPDLDLYKKYFDFIKFINNKKSKVIHDLNDASEACFNTNDLINNVEFRLKNNISSFSNKLEYAKFFLENNLYPEWNNIKKNLKEIYPDKNLDCYEKIISPSDVGFHNCVVNNGNLFFFDFEHSGMDDLAKLAIDLTLQPDWISIDNNIELMLNIFNKINISDKNWLFRYYKYLPIYRIKWCSIMLNRLSLNNEDHAKEALIKYFNKITNYYKFSSEIIKKSQISCKQIIESKKKDV